MAVIGAPDMNTLIHKRFLRNERVSMRARGPLRPARRGRADRDETFVRCLDRVASALSVWRRSTRRSLCVAQLTFEGKLVRDAACLEKV